MKKVEVEDVKQISKHEGSTKMEHSRIHSTSQHTTPQQQTINNSMTALIKQILIQQSNNPSQINTISIDNNKKHKPTNYKQCAV